MFRMWFLKSVFLKRSFVCEQLEDRIVLDAAVPGTPDNSSNDQNPDNQALDSHPGAHPDTDATTQGTQDASSLDTHDQSETDVTVVITGDSESAPGTGTAEGNGTLRVLVVSSTLSDSDLLLSAAQDSVITVLYDGSTDNLNTILSDIRNALGDQKADSIAFATHELGEAHFSLSADCSVDLSTVAANQDLKSFWQGIGSLLSENGRVDLMVCDLVSTDAGCALVSQIENLVGHEVTASDDPTGNPDFGGDWILEHGHVDVASTYFVSNVLSEYDGILADEQPVLSFDGSGDSLNYTEGDGPQVIESLITITDSDSENMASATIRITGNYQDGEDVLDIEAGHSLGADVTATWVQSTGTLELSGSATKAEYEAILEHVTYTNGSDAPDTGDRTVTWVVNDGTSDSDPQTTTISLTPVNDAPEGADKAITMLEDGTYTLTASDFGFNDPLDSPGNAFESVTITQLPTEGSLQLDSAEVVLDQVISRADIDAGRLTFTPNADGNGTDYSNFRFAVTDDGGTANGGEDTDETPNTITFEVHSG